MLFLQEFLGIFTAHGNDFNEIVQNPIMNKLFSRKLIQRIIFLSEKEKGQVKDVYFLENSKYFKLEG